MCHAAMQQQLRVQFLPIFQQTRLPLLGEWYRVLWPHLFGTDHYDAVEQSARRDFNKSFMELSLFWNVMFFLTSIRYGVFLLAIARLVETYLMPKGILTS